jgi:DNA polymerase III delta subunit
MTRPGLHLFLGPDRPWKLSRLRELEAALGVQPLDRHQVDASSTTAKELLSLCRQRPAVSPLRLVVVDQAHRLGADAVDALLAHAEVIAHSACVVLLVEAELGLRQALAKALQGRGERGGLAVERFPGRGGSSAKPFALTDALGTRDAAEALAAMREQVVAGKEPLELLGLIAWQVTRWVTVKRLSEAGYSAERMAAATGLHSWQVQRARAEVADRPLGALRQALERCWRLDADAKRGRTLPELAVEQLLIEICLTGR